MFLITAAMMCVDSETQKVTSILKLENAVEVKTTKGFRSAYTIREAKEDGEALSIDD